MRANKEYKICKAIAQYLRLQYPKVMFHYDYAGLNLSKAQAGQMKAIQGGRGYPDLFIAHPVKGAKGLFIEVKADTPYLKDGITLKSNAHLKEQQDCHVCLRDRGYVAVFGTGFDECKEIIDMYLKTT